MIHRGFVVVGLAALVGCGGVRPGGSTTPDNHVKVGIEAAGLPYQILDRAGHQVDTEQFWAKVGATRAVCVGEEHPNPHHHWVQLEVVKRLAKQGHLAVGMEMVQRPFQGILDDFAAGHIDAKTLRSRVDWENRWGYDYGLYGPTLDAAIGAHSTLLALNAPKELTRKISHHGLESLTAEEKAQVPQLDLANPTHRAWFDALMEEMGGSSAHSVKAPPATTPTDPPKEDPAPPSPHHDDQGDPDEHAMPSAERIYTVQVVWDETMADTSVKWLQANPQGHLVILAGNGHCHDSAIVGRIKRRGVADVISLRPVVDDGDGAVADLLAKPQNDYLVVLAMPKEMKDAEAKAAKN